MAKSKPFYVTLIIAFISFLQQTCWAQKNCSCICLNVEINQNDSPHSVWEDIEPEALQTLGCAEVTFVSKDANSHVCLQQIHALSEIQDPNVELIVSENHVEHFTLKYSPSKWEHREICSKRNSLTFQLKKLDTNLALKSDSLFLYFQIVHIESYYYRKLYMQNLYCDGTYKLQKSRIEIFSKETNSSPRTSQECQLHLEKLRGSNYNMCLYYQMTSAEGMSRDNWAMYVSTEKYSLKPNHVVLTINANSSHSGAWCSSLDSVYLIFQRTNQKNLIHEDNVVTLFAMDFNGTTEQFLDYINSTFNTASSTTHSTPKTEASNAHAHVIVPILVVFVGLIILLVILFMFLFTRYLCRKVTKRTAFSNTLIQHQRKYTKKDILVISSESSECEHKNFLNSL